MSPDNDNQEPSFSLEAAHAADKEKTRSNPPRPATREPDFAHLRARALDATHAARDGLDDAEDG